MIECMRDASLGLPATLKSPMLVKSRAIDTKITSHPKNRLFADVMICTFVNVNASYAAVEQDDIENIRFGSLLRHIGLYHLV